MNIRRHRLGETSNEQAALLKSAAEVTKDFIKESSYILRAAIGGPGAAFGAKGKSAAAVAKKAKPGPSLRDTKQLAVNQILS